ncbi:MAG: dihydrolipoyl dehydrogenase [Planctomycetes bacterium]|nr:dihydrolipoyl dehydrogenase [Planctomycetota bacterium]
MNATKTTTQLLVLGGGPGGYPAAFLAADLGLEVTLVDAKPNPGGICLFEGCIPSKTLLHVAKLIHEAAQAEKMGVTFGPPSVDLDKLRYFKNGVVGKLTGGLGVLKSKRKVNFVRGRGIIQSPHTVEVDLQEGGKQLIEFEHLIIATGSSPTRLPFLDHSSPHIWDSTNALELREVPRRLLIIGGGYIGMEMGTVYAALGSEVTVVEALGSIIAAADPDLVAPVADRARHIFHELRVDTKVVEVVQQADGLHVRLLGLDIENPQRVYDKILVCVGRQPNSKNIGLENTSVQVDARGFIVTDHQRRTAEPHIFAIGDVTGEPMLAHKATYEGRVAAEVLAGKPSAYDPKCIPAVVFTDPELAWVGITETEALNRNIPFKIAAFPWSAAGRATSLDRNDGLTKMIVDPNDEVILGIGIVGVGAGELIAEGALAIEMGCTVTDLKMTVHAHPTLSETVMESAEVYHGHSAHYMPRKR